MLPQAYAYPAEMRATRDLLRRRSRLVRMRAELLGHVQLTKYQYNLAPFKQKIAYRAGRRGVAEHFDDVVVRQNVDVDIEVIDHLETTIKSLEANLVRQTKVHDVQTFHRLRTVPGIGQVLAMTILYEVEDVARFSRVQQFASYARLVKGQKSSAGKKLGTSGGKMGNRHLKWAFSEAVILYMRESERARKFVARMESKHGKGKAISILAAKLGRAIYFMMRRQEVFDEERLFATG
jgi:transposase